MKKFFSLVVVAATAASAFAFESANNNVRTFADVLPAKSKMVSTSEVNNLNVAAEQKSAAEAVNAAAASASPYDAFYQMKNVMPLGYDFGEQGFGYGYSTPLCMAPVAGAQCVGKYGDRWTIGTADTDITEEIVDNTYSIDGQVGGTYYMPKIWNGGESYYFGSDGSKASVGYGVAIVGEYDTEVEEMRAFGNYNVFSNSKWYGGFANTVAFGSRKFTNTKGEVITANSLLIEYEVAKDQNLVLDHIDIPVVLSADENGNDYTELWENDDVTLTATIIEDTDVEGEYNTYHAVITKADNLSLVSEDYRLQIFFTEEEDGFETTITPVLHNNFQLLINGFAQEGIHIGIMMMYDENSYEDESGYVSEYYSHSYFDQYVDGVESKPGAFYCDNRVEAIVNLVGSYYTLCDYRTGSNTLTGWVSKGATTHRDPEIGTFCVAETEIDAETGKVYNDFDISTCAAIEDITVESEDPYLLGYEFDDQYLESDGVLVMYLYTKPLEEGANTHTINGTISTEMASCNFEVVLKGEDSENNISNVEAATKTAIYNLMGQEVKNADKGLFLIGGKKVMK